MKVPFEIELEAKDILKLLVLLGTGGAAIYAGHSQSGGGGERLAVLETKVERMQSDVSDIKNMLQRRQWSGGR